MTLVATLVAELVLAYSARGAADGLTDLEDFDVLSHSLATTGFSIAAAIAVAGPLAYVAKSRLADVGLSWAWLSVAPMLGLRALAWVLAGIVLEGADPGVRSHMGNPFLDIANWVGVFVLVGLALIPSRAVSRAPKGGLVARLRDATSCEGRIESRFFWRLLGAAVALYVFSEASVIAAPVPGLSDIVVGLAVLAQVGAAVAASSALARRMRFGTMRET